MNTIQNNNYIILTDLCSKISRVVYIDSAKSQTINFLYKYVIPVSFIIGLEYGTTITLTEDRKWAKCKRLNIDQLVENLINIVETSTIDSNKNTSKNNVQQLSPQSIINLKLEGISVYNLILDLCKNSKTFNIKTKYAKEKYIKRKLERHLLQIGLNSCDIINIYNAYCKSNKLAGIQLNYITNIINIANINEDSNVIVFDQVLGLLAGSIYNRLGNQGKCIYISQYCGTSHHVYSILQKTSSKKTEFCEFPYDLLLELQNNNFDTCLLEREYNNFFIPRSIDEFTNNIEKCVDINKIVAGVNKKNKNIIVRNRIVQEMKNNKIDAIVGCINNNCFDYHDPSESAKIMSILVELSNKILKPGGKLAIYNYMLNPLFDLYSYIKNSNESWTDCKLYEMLTRNFVCTDEISHPIMSTSIDLTGGFILACTKLRS